jgi:NitT/TauT family transport system substrate-binding protein
MKEKLGDNAISWPGGQDFYFVLLTKEDWIKNNPAAAERFIKSVLEAEDYIKDNSEEAKEFVKNRFDYESDYIDYSWPKQEFAVGLEQAMLITFEDQARWRIKQGLTDATEVPNYLYYIYMDALEEVKPEAIGIIR